jgi:hypothetical protein
MRGSLTYGPPALFAAAAAGLFIFIAALASGAAGTASAQSPETTLGIDANPEGNTASSLGARDRCIQVRSGDAFDVDVTIENVAALTALELYLTYDAEVVKVTDRNVKNHFLAVAGESSVFDASQSVPDEDGRYRVQAFIITTDEPIGADGSGVLARLQLAATGAGVTTLSLTPSPTDIADRPVAATLTNVDAAQIGDSDGDSHFDGPILDAQIAVDQACPGQEGDSPVISSGAGGDGIPAWLIFAAAAGIITAGAGGAALFVLRRSNPRAS